MTDASLSRSINVFVSYSHKNKKEKDRLLTFLRLPSIHKLGVWSDDRLKPGVNWLPEIEAAMAEAQVAILLITADFLASGFIQNVEVPRLLERKKTAGVLVVPVIARACPWKRVKWLYDMDVRPKTGPIWRPGGHVDGALAAIVDEILEITCGPVHGGGAAGIKPTQTQVGKSSSTPVGTTPAASKPSAAQIRKQIQEEIMLYLYDKGPGGMVSVPELVEVLDDAPEDLLISTIWNLDAGDWIETEGVSGEQVLCSLTDKGRIYVHAYLSDLI
jgi:hypothetical protein